MKVQEMEQLVKQVTAFTVANSAERDSWEKAIAMSGLLAWGLCDPALDEIMEESDRSLDFAHRKPLLDQAQVRLAETARSLPLYYNVIPQVVSRRIGNFRPSGTNFGSFWNLWAWTLG